MREHAHPPLARDLTRGALLIALALAGCDDDPKPKTPDMTPEGGDPAGVMSPTPDMGGAGPTPDMGEPGGEMEPDMMMSGRVRTINDCEQLCGVYDTCGLTDASPWGADCLAGCGAQDWADQGFRSYVACMKLEPCDTLSSCRVPAPPLPTCEEACALTDACDQDFRLPTALTQMGTCGSACADPTWARQISACVQEASLDLCGSEPEFAACVLEARGGDCLDICASRARCDEGIDAIDCAIECLMEAPEADPLAERRRQQQRTCLSGAQSCEAVSACLEPPAPPISEAAAAACAGGEACGALAEGACPEVMAEVAGGLRAEGISCLTSALTGSCDASLVPCLTQELTPDRAACDDYCLAARLCGALPAGQSELDCVDACVATLGTGSASRLACAEASSCPDFTACVSGGGGVGGCEALCADRAACGQEEEGACLTRCEARSATLRTRVEGSCAALLTCEASDATCALPPAPACEELCGPLSECGIAPDGCVVACDDAALLAPEAFLPRLACVNATDRCDRRSACDQDTSAGDACLAYCERAQGCDGGEGSVESCVLTCARGELSAPDREAFLLASACLASARGQGCEALDACFTSAPASSALCAEVCAAVSACGFEQAAAGEAACVSACEADPSAWGEGLSCVAQSARRGEGCLGAAGCLGVAPPVPTAECESFCARQRVCDPGVDLFLCHAQCIEEVAGDLLRATCAELVECSGFSRCASAGDVAPSQCVSACEAVLGCDGAVGAGGRFEFPAECVDVCGGVAASVEDSTGERVAQCVTAAACDPSMLDGCFAGELAPPAGELCARSWAAVTQCGFEMFLGLTEGQFLMDCAAEVAQDPMAALRQVECLEGAYAMDPTCFSAFGCFF
jgi:hypothetical protein